MKLTQAQQAFLLRVFEDPDCEEAVACEAILARALDKGEPWAICAQMNFLRDLNKCAVIDQNGRLVYDLKLLQKPEIVRLKKEE